MKQLQMVWPKARHDSPPTWRLQPGYRLRIYQPGDDEGYVRVMNRAGFENWNPEKAAASREKSLPGGLFFVIHEASGMIVATAAAQQHPAERHPYVGELGWVAADPEHRGRGLGHAVCAAATRRLLEADLPGLFLLTDDHRLPAIRTYLKLGWVPRLHAPDMEGRWKAVCEGLGIELESTGYVGY